LIYDVVVEAAIKDQSALIAHQAQGLHSNFELVRPFGRQIDALFMLKRMQQRLPATNEDGAKPSAAGLALIQGLLK
jgi:hypothetical protein